MAAKERTPGELLREYRERKGWSLREVAKRAGVSHGTVRGFEQRTNYEGVQAGTITALAKGYGMSEARFRRVLGGAYDESVGAGPDQLRVNPDWVAFPVRATVSAGDAQPEYLLGEVAYIPREHLRRRGASPDTVDVFQVNGTCMVSDEARRAPKNFADGDYVAVDRNRAPRTGEVVVAWWDTGQKLIIKRWEIDHGKTILYPLSAAHPAIEVDLEDDVKLLGPVVWRGG
jgi:transcriptional regulator with XRE-family HTH domain